jgi:hypothetical protein
VISSIARYRDVRQKDVTFVRVWIPVEHRVDGRAELGAARLVNTTRISEVLCAIASSSLSAEIGLFEASLLPVPSVMSLSVTS